MRTVFTRRIMILLVALLALGLCFDEASAQRRRTRRSRRITNPVATRPVESRTVVPSTGSTEPQIISTADEQASEQNSAPEVSGQIARDSAPDDDSQARE